MNNTHRESYLDTRRADEFDLVGAVRTTMLNAGLGQRIPEFFDSNIYIIDAANKKPEVQRYLLNRYFNTQLMNADANSIDERFCLIPNGEIADWLRLFTDKVLPFIIANDLPKGI